MAKNFRRRGFKQNGFASLNSLRSLKMLHVLHSLNTMQQNIMQFHVAALAFSLSRSHQPIYEFVEVSEASAMAGGNYTHARLGNPTNGNVV